MKRIIRNTVSVLLFALVVFMICPEVAQAAVKLNKTSETLFVGESLQLSVKGTSKKVSWKSSNAKVAKVSSKGKVVAKKGGNATITATVSGSKEVKQCKIKVNKTFKVNKKSISIKNTANLKAYLSASGGVMYYPAVPKNCTVTFGKWDGDYLPFTIEPKKVGTEKIRFTNTENSEEWVLTVKVTALPVKATFDAPVINSGAKDLIAGENTVDFSFRTNRKGKNVELRIYDENNKVVRKFALGALAAKKKTTVTWDGLNASGQPLSGTCTYAVLADGTKTVGGTIKVLPVSPFGKGDGTAANPYMVSDAAELMLLKSYNGSYFAQDADIDFNYMPTAALFDESTPFTGHFTGKSNGRSYRMTNLMGYQSIFGSIGQGGVIRDLTLSNCVVNSLGSFLAYTNLGTIENCNVTGNILCNAGQPAAMLVINNKGQIRDCNVSGNMSVTASGAIASTALKAGGVAVRNEGTIAQCVSSVVLTQELGIGTFLPTSNYEIYSGGIVAENGTGAFITQCTFTGSIDAKVKLPELMKDTEVSAGKFYTGFVAGRNDSYISTCVNASANKDLTAFGTGTGMVQ